ncbi:hypothetical protein PUN28_005042 [Cardiocondyla obscurior]|uniref:Uncharacterized protein n=1 Tax=Cardiocondyla obscurior TaxID=286306 RepID=A0AAW2GHS4_9HYME
MNFGADHYYKLNRIFLSTIGLWPYDDIKTRYICVILWLSICLPMTVTQLLKLITTKHDVELILKVLSSALPFMLFTVKYVTFYFVTEKIKGIMQQIQNDWNALKDKGELDIIRQYAKIARSFTTTIASKKYFYTINALNVRI